MAKRSSSKSQKNGKNSNSTVSKGKIVERIAALMHEQPSVTVERNRRHLPVSGQGSRREIDVLLTAPVAGYSVRMAIECKNEAKPIGTPKIDAFFGKLEHVGIPPQQGIYVSASGYTTGAIKRAKDVGIRTLTLSGLKDTDLLSSISDAFQSTIYLLLEVLNVTVTNTASPPEASDQIGSFGFYNEDGKLVAVLPDFVWRAWQTGQIPNVLGEHEVNLPLPTNLHQQVNGRSIETSAFKTKIRVIGLALTLQGKAQNYALVNAADKVVERALTDVSFGGFHPKLPLTAITSEEQLQTFLSRPGAVRVTTRIGLPRIVYGSLYWPPSERVVSFLKERAQASADGKLSEPPEFTLQELEGTDLQTIWEPIVKEHPAHQWIKDEIG